MIQKKDFISSPFPIYIFLLSPDLKARETTMFFKLNSLFINLFMEQILIKSSCYMFETVLSTVESKTYNSLHLRMQHLVGMSDTKWIIAQFWNLKYNRGKYFGWKKIQIPTWVYNRKKCSYVMITSSIGLQVTCSTLNDVFAKMKMESITNLLYLWLGQIYAETQQSKGWVMI